MFSKIVVGTDGSENAERALREVLEMTEVHPAKDVQIVTAYRPLSFTEIRDLANDLPAEFRDVINPNMEAESRLDAARAMFGSRDQAVGYRGIDDDATDAILDVAEEIGADLIVVGSRGERAARRAIHGSVSTKVLHNATCSVLVVK